MDIQVEERASLDVRRHPLCVRIPLTFYPGDGRTNILAGAKATGVRIDGAELKGNEFDDVVVISADWEGQTVPKLPIEISAKHHSGRDILWFEVIVQRHIATDEAALEVDLQLNFPPDRLIEITVPVKYVASAQRVECGRLRRKTPSTIPVLNTMLLYILFGILIAWNTQKNIAVHAGLFSQQQIAYGVGAVIGFLSLPTLRSLKAMFTVHGIHSLLRFPELVFDRLYLRIMRPPSVLCLNVLICGGVLYLLLGPFDTIVLPKSPSGEVLFDSKLNVDVNGERIFRKDCALDRYFYYSGRVFEEIHELFKVASLCRDRAGSLSHDPIQFRLDDTIGGGYAGTFAFGKLVDPNKPRTEYPNTLLGDIYTCIMTRGFQTPRVVYDGQEAKFTWGGQPAMPDYEIRRHLRDLVGVAASVIAEHAKSNGGDFHCGHISDLSNLLEGIKQQALTGLSRPEVDALSRVTQTAVAKIISEDLRKAGSFSPKGFAAHLYGAITLVELNSGDTHADNQTFAEIRGLMKLFAEYAQSGVVAEDQEVFVMFNSLLLRMIRNTESSDLLSAHIDTVNELVSKMDKTGVDRVTDYLWTYLDVFESRTSDSFPRWETMMEFFKRRLEKLTDNNIWPERREALIRRFNSGPAKVIVASLAAALPGPSN